MVNRSATEPLSNRYPSASARLRVAAASSPIHLNVFASAEDAKRALFGLEAEPAFHKAVSKGLTLMARRINFARTWCTVQPSDKPRSSIPTSTTSASCGLGAIQRTCEVHGRRGGKL